MGPYDLHGTFQNEHDEEQSININERSFKEDNQHYREDVGDIPQKSSEWIPQVNSLYEEKLYPFSSIDLKFREG